MIRFVVVMVLIAMIWAILPAVGNCQQLSIKQNFWGSWKYSTDGIEYNSFGPGWSDFQSTLEENEEAFNYSKSAKTLFTIGNIAGIPGGALLGWNTGTAIGGGEPKGWMWVAGGALTAVAISMEIAFRSKLHKAVESYNIKIKEKADSPVTQMRFCVTPGWIGLRFSFD